MKVEIFIEQKQAGSERFSLKQKRGSRFGKALESESNEEVVVRLR